MIKRKNILMLISSLAGGGAQRVMCILAAELAKKHNVYLAAFLCDEQAFPVGDAVVIRLPKDTVSEGVTVSQKRLNAVRDIKKYYNIDVSISFLYLLNRINMETMGNEKVICCERSNPKMKKCFEETRFIYALSDEVVFQSELVRDFYDESIRKKSHVLPNPVYISCMAEPTRKKRVVNVGRLHEQKNQIMLIKAFVRFHQIFPEYTLSIYGDGNIRGILEDLIRKLCCEEYVFLEGMVSNVHERIKDADMFVLSSDYEGLSNALLEAMMMGIASISTRVPGSVDVIKSGENGILIDIGDEDALFDSMCMLAKDEALKNRIQENAIRDISKYSVKNTTILWENIL